MLNFVYLFIPKTLRELSTEDAAPLYYLYESNVCPDKREGFRVELEGDSLLVRISSASLKSSARIGTREVVQRSQIHRTECHHYYK